MNHSFISKMKVNWTRTAFRWKWSRDVTFQTVRAPHQKQIDVASDPQDEERINFILKQLFPPLDQVNRKEEDDDNVDGQWRKFSGNYRMTWWFLDSRSSSSQLSIKSDRQRRKSFKSKWISPAGFWNSMNWVVRLLINGPLTCWAKIESPMKCNISLFNQLSSWWWRWRLADTPTRNHSSFDSFNVFITRKKDENAKSVNVKIFTRKHDAHDHNTRWRYHVPIIFFKSFSIIVFLKKKLKLQSPLTPSVDCKSNLCGWNGI